MDVLANLFLGLSVAVTPTNLLWCLIGVFLGTAIGVLPGLGPSATIAMLLPATFGLEPVSALIMMAGIFYGAQYGGSTTAILINLPGSTSTSSRNLPSAASRCSIWKAIAPSIGWSLPSCSVPRCWSRRWCAPPSATPWPRRRRMSGAHCLSAFLSSASGLPPLSSRP